MYCVKCGVKLADTEEKCPLCHTAIGEQVIRNEAARSMYPKDHYPEVTMKRGAVNGAILFLFWIPILVTFFVDLQTGRLDWFWYVAGGIVLLYVVLALPMWFPKPNPVIFVPCDFTAAALYLWLIQMLTDGRWFGSFALPVTAGIGLTTTTVVVLLRYVRKGKLYIFGGAMIAMGGMLLLTEFLIAVTFGAAFGGWSIYPLVVLAMLGGLLIFLAINSAVREKMERKFFI